MWRRVVLTAFALMFSASAQAACNTHPIALTERAYTGALLKRMRPLGVRSIDRASVDNGRNAYILSGSSMSMFITPENDLMKEIAFVLSDPSDQVDVNQLMHAAAFTVAELSGSSEQAVAVPISSDINAQAGEKMEFFPPAAIIIAHPAGALVARVSLTSCMP